MIWVSATPKVYIQASDEVQTLDSLFRIAGISKPEVVYPATGDTLLYFIEKSGLRDALTPDMQTVLDKLTSSFSGKSMLKINGDLAMDILPTATLEGNCISTDVTAFPTYYWARPYKDIEPFVKGEVGFLFSKYLYGLFEVEYEKRMENLYLEQFELNQIFIPTSANLTYPHEAYISGGLDWLNLLVGRVRVSAGGGVTGNMAFGDNFIFRDMAKLSISSYPVCYDLLINRFNSEDGSNTNHRHLEVGKAAPVVVIHRMTASLFSKLTLTLYEGLLEWTSGSALNLKLLNPFMILHNQNSYAYGEANNFFGFELDWTMTRSLSSHFEVIFDQIQMKTENDVDKPNAYGFLANVEGSIAIGRVLLDWHVEGAYTSPALYLKSSNDRSVYKNYMVDLIAGNTLWDHSDVSYLGYGYGPNSVVAQAGVQLSDPLGSQKIGMTVLFKGTGDTGLYRDEMCPTVGQINSRLSPCCITETNQPEYLLQVRMAGSKAFFDGIVTCYGDVACQNYWNFKNSPGATNFNVQISLGVKIEPAGFWI